MGKSKTAMLEYSIDNEKYKGRNKTHNKGRHTKIGPIGMHPKYRTRQRVIITNMESATDCTGKKLGLCQLCKTKAKCYAMIPEIQYPDCLPYRRRQSIQWIMNDASFFISEIQGIQSRARTKITHHRLNEAGEMKDINCFKKAAAISRANKAIGITTFIYTTRIDLWKKVKKTKWFQDSGLVVNGSGFMANNEYRVVQADYQPKSKNEVWCRDNCHICQLCKKRNGLTILAKVRHE